MRRKVFLPLFIYLIAWFASIALFANAPGLFGFPLYFEMVGFYLPVAFIIFLLVSLYKADATADATASKTAGATSAPVGHVSADKSAAKAAEQESTATQADAHVNSQVNAQGGKQ